MIGLVDRLLYNYVEWIANRRMKAIGLAPMFDIPAKNNFSSGLSIGLTLRVNRMHLRKRRLNVMSSEESNKMSHQEPSLDFLCSAGILDAAEQGLGMSLLDSVDQPAELFAEALWEMEKKKARQEEERNTRHSVDKGEDFIKSGMTLITDRTDRYLNKSKKVSTELPVNGIHAINIVVTKVTNFTFISQCSVSYWH